MEMNITGLNFYAGTSINSSSSIIGQTAAFLFYMLTGNEYTCIIDYGDGSPQITFQDQPYNLNNTYMYHYYAQPSENMYQVQLNCSNSISNQSIALAHFTQYELKDLQLVKYGVAPNTPYSIDFMVTSGSTPYLIESLVDGIIDNGVAKDLIGSVWPSIVYKASSRNGETNANVYNVYVRLANLVSMVELNSTFEISAPIQNPTFSITPITNNPQMAEFTYEYVYNANEISFNIGIQAGANVKVAIFTGDELTYSPILG